MSPVRFLRGFLLLALGFIAACSSDEPSSNRIPTVLLTSGPVEGDTVLYRITLAWTGEDPDGSVTRFEFAVDPPAAFSETEIAEGGPGIIQGFVPGAGTAPDVTRMTKTEGGQTVAFDWVHTVDTSREFKFSTPTAESTFAGGTPVATGRFHGMHAVYVRAVDDDGAVSFPDRTAFTSVTVAPRSSIVRPYLGSWGLTLGPTLHAAWAGMDIDGPGREPVGYYYALVRYAPPWIIIWPPTPEQVLSSATWIYQDADTSSWVGELVVPNTYAFAVRAVDENGVVEPFLDWGRNAFTFQALASGGKPVLSIAYQGSTWTFPSSAGTTSLEVPAGRPLDFLLSCSAEAYGETCDGYRWGLDLTDLDVEEGWTPWSGNAKITFEPPEPSGIHVLYVQARDALGTTTTGALILDVVELAFDREVLMVDDSFDDTFPNDSQHDAFWHDLVGYYAANSDLPEEQFSYFDAHGAGDRGTLAPNIPLLSELGRYKLLIWECRGSGYNSVTALVGACAKTPRLAAYLGAGGKLWLGGRMTVGATVPAANGTGGDLSYPKEGLGRDLRPGDFAWDFLKLHSSKIINDKGERVQNLMNRAKTFQGFTVYYDTLIVDLPKLSNAQRANGGFSHADAVSDPILAESEPDFRGNIDSLYVYGAAANEFQGRNSNFHNKLCALRWSDPDPDRLHGRIQWFGFSMYYTDLSHVERVFKTSVDWFREEVPITP